MKMARVLIIEEDKNSAMAIKDSLEFEGFEAIISLSGKDGLNRALNETYDIILMEILLPEIDGYELLRELRKVKKDIPVIIFSEKNNDEDKVFALNLGADDYVTKPFSMMEMIARIRAQLRRVNLLRGSSISHVGPYPGYEPVTIKIGNSLVYLDKMVSKLNDDEFPLTPKELGIIRLLYKNRGKVVGRDMMMKEIWGEEVYVTERVIDTNVVSIRKKIGDTGRRAKYIKTVFGVGYKLIEG
jgi:DNA-binding response OmpR family regulator